MVGARIVQLVVAEEVVVVAEAEDEEVGEEGLLTDPMR